MEVHKNTFRDRLRTFPKSESFGLFCWNTTLPSSHGSALVNSEFPGCDGFVPGLQC